MPRHKQPGKAVPSRDRPVGTGSRPLQQNILIACTAPLAGRQERQIIHLALLVGEPRVEHLLMLHGVGTGVLLLV